MQEYADPVIDWLDAGRGILSRRLFREVSRAINARARNLWLMDVTAVMYTATQRVIFQGPVHCRA